MVRVSQAATAETEREVPEVVVRNRSRYADTLHRPAPDSAEPRPACPIRQSDREYTDVSAASYLGHYALCKNPECFGRDWR